MICPGRCRMCIAFVTASFVGASAICLTLWDESIGRHHGSEAAPKSGDWLELFSDEDGLLELAIESVAVVKYLAQRLCSESIRGGQR